MLRHSRTAALAALATALALPACVVHGAETTPRQVGLFAGIAAGQLEVEAFAPNAKKVNVLVTNKTAEPLEVAVPAAVSVVPALAQFADGFDWDDLRPKTDDAPQRVGAGPQGPWQQPFQRGQQQFNPFNVNMNALFNVPPERVVRVEMVGLCLDHGAPEPNARLPVVLMPIDQTLPSEEVPAIVRLFATERVERNVAQLAVWNLANGVSWESLAAERVKLSIGTRPRYSDREIEQAKRLVAELRKRADRRARPVSTAAR